MANIEALEKERDQILLDKIMGKTIDFSKLREVCRKFQKEVECEMDIETDESLWKSVNFYLNKKIGIHK